MNQKNITLGTAGHIDHGKTALIRNLTGCETDRLREERERGMSIELGFAPWKVGDLEVGIVDVPGHENFVKTMVAGATGIDAVILVIAVDDGIMPQTREHLDILSLLGVEHGVVVLTKVDKVTAERLGAVRGEVRDYLQGTFLRDAPVYPFSNVTGEGFEPFYDGLLDLVRRLKPKQTDGIFRLPIERTFSVKGYGTIASGIPVSGAAQVGDPVIVHPAGLPGRIKAIQVYQVQAERVQCGQCAALNVPQWDAGALSRGDVITLDGWFSPGSWYLCEMEILPLEGPGLKHGAEVRFHTGTSESTATVYLLEGDRAAGGTRSLVQVQLGQQIVAGPMDRFILRALSPARTIGGGVVIEALERKLRRSRPEVVEDAKRRAAAVQNDADFAEYAVLSAPDGAISVKAVAHRIKKALPGTEKLLQGLAGSGAVIALEQGLFMHARTVENLGLKALKRLAMYHQSDPASPGMPLDAVAAEYGWERPVAARVFGDLAHAGKARIENGVVCLAGHSVRFDSAEEKRLQRVERLFLERMFNPPERGDLPDLCGLTVKEVDNALRLLVEHRRLVRIDRNLHFHADAVAKAREIAVGHLRKENRLESVAWKYLIDTSRKYALPLLDYFDRIGVTKRAPDNTRHLGPRA